MTLTTIVSIAVVLCSVVVIAVAIVITRINTKIIREAREAKRIIRNEAPIENPLLKPREPNRRELYDQHAANEDYGKTLSENTDESKNSADERGVNEQ